MALFKVVPLSTLAVNVQTKITLGNNSINLGIISVKLKAFLNQHVQITNLAWVILLKVSVKERIFIILSVIILSKIPILPITLK